MNKKKLTKETGLTFPDFIHFLKNEFGLISLENIKKTEKKIVRNIKKESVVAKENFHKIGKLIDDALKNLPDIEDLPADHDEKHSNKWQTLHAEIKKDLHKQKTVKSRSNSLLSGAGILVDGKNTYAYTWKTLSIAMLLVSIILSNTYFCINPKALDNFLSYINFDLNQDVDNKIAFSNNQMAINPDLSDVEIAAAKAVYIVKNQEKIKNNNRIGVSAKDLFGSKADASIISNETAQPNVKQNKISEIAETVKTSWINFFKILFNKS